MPGPISISSIICACESLSLMRCDVYCRFILATATLPGCGSRPIGVGHLWSTPHLSIMRYLVIVRLVSSLRIFSGGLVSPAGVSPGVPTLNSDVIASILLSLIYTKTTSTGNLILMYAKSLQVCSLYHELAEWVASLHLMVPVLGYNEEGGPGTHLGGRCDCALL